MSEPDFGTRILYISGDEYAAIDYEDAVMLKEVNPDKLWQESMRAGEDSPLKEMLEGKSLQGRPLEYIDPEHRFMYQALVFDIIDKNFMKFIKEVYEEESKHANFYVVQ